MPQTDALAARDLLPSSGRSRRLRRLLLAWFAAEARELPWRTTRDPYRVLVSEVMLQQTQAQRVAPIYQRFCAQFPSVTALAAAPVGDVVTAWAGLGYNRRAINLHRAATEIVTAHNGRVPADLDALRRLPGVGEYTARAVLAFAFDVDVAPVDVNVARVLARGVAGAPLSRPQAQQLADGMAPAGQAAAWAGALMDLGARFCTKRAPRCDACPVAAACSWRRDGTNGSPGPENDAGDPAASGGVRSRVQAPFAGSDRYHRGHLVESLRHGPVACDDLPSAADLGDSARLAALTSALVDDGLAEWADGALQLPS